MAKLTPAERAILIAQYRTLAAISDDGEEYSDIITILTDGYEAEYEEHIDGMREPLPEDETKHVRDILWIYYLMKLARNREALDDPGGDRDEHGGLRMEKLEPKFPGFDGNNQARLLGYAKFLISLGQFPEHKPVVNSHGGQPDYYRMIDLHDSWGRPSKLTEAQVKELLRD